MKRFLFISLGIWVIVMMVWWSPFFQQWKHDYIEHAAIEHFESEHDHYYDQVMFPKAEAVPETLFVDRGGKTVFRVGEDTIRVNLDELPDENFDHEHFGVSADTLIANVQHFADWLLDPNRINAIAMLIMVLGNAVAGVWWKFKMRPKT